MNPDTVLRIGSIGLTIVITIVTLLTLRAKGFVRSLGHFLAGLLLLVSALTMMIAIGEFAHHNWLSVIGYGLVALAGGITSVKRVCK